MKKDLHKKVKKTILVYIPEELAVQRAQKRTGLIQEEILKRLKQQISIEKKKEMADYVIDNSGSLKDLEPQIEKLWSEISKDTEKCQRKKKQSM